MASMSNNNWLGFSLSTHMNMEMPPDPHHAQSHRHQPTQPTSSTAAASSSAGPCTFFLSPAQLNSSGICYGVGGDNGSLYSQLSVMPLKSDGSLCIMEALSKSQQQGMVPSPPPKLEDFLGGGPNLGTHHLFGNNDRGAMALSLDSIYYHQTSEAKVNRNQSIDLHGQQAQQVQQHQPLYFQRLQDGMCSEITNQESYQTTMEEGAMTDDGFPSLKSWVARHYDASNYEPGEEGGNSCGLGYGDLQSLRLSMSPGSQSSCITAPQQVSPPAECMALESPKRKASGKGSQKQPVHRKSIDTFGHRTSQYRGVTRHRWTGRYEAHLWDNSCKKEGQTRKGRQVYLGGYDMEEKAARAYDLAALKYWGPSTHINFPLESYGEELEGMKNMSRQEYVAHLRRKSSGFSRGASIYRGVTRHHQHGRWQARIGRVAGNKDLYLGTFSTQEEAAEAYDVAAIKFRGLNAVTNFDITRYDVEKIIASNTLLPGELVKRTKAIEVNKEEPSEQNNGKEPTEENSTWSMVLHQPAQHTQTTSGTLDHKSVSFSTDYQNSMLFTSALHGLVSADAASMAQAMNDPENVGIAQLSNASSLVTSLGSSKEGSPEGNCFVMKCVEPLQKFPNPTSLSSWIPSTQIGPGITMAHMPVFAAWSDA